MSLQTDQIVGKTYRTVFVKAFCASRKAGREVVCLPVQGADRLKHSFAATTVCIARCIQSLPVSRQGDNACTLKLDGQAHYQIKLPIPRSSGVTSRELSDIAHICTFPARHWTHLMPNLSYLATSLFPHLHCSTWIESVEL